MTGHLIIFAPIRIDLRRLGSRRGDGDESGRRSVIDSTTDTGRMFLHPLAAPAEWERDRLAERTSEGVAYARESYGHVSGRSRGTPEELAARIVRERPNPRTVELPSLGR